MSSNLKSLLCRVKQINKCAEHNLAITMESYYTHHKIKGMEMNDSKVMIFFCPRQGVVTSWCLVDSNLVCLCYSSPWTSFTLWLTASQNVEAPVKGFCLLPAVCLWCMLNIQKVFTLSASRSLCLSFMHKRRGGGECEGLGATRSYSGWVYIKSYI